VRQLLILLMLCVAGQCVADHSSWNIGFGVSDFNIHSQSENSLKFSRETIWNISALWELASNINLETRFTRYDPPHYELPGATHSLSMNSLMLSLRYQPCFGTACPYIGAGWNVSRSEGGTMLITYPETIRIKESSTRIGWQTAAGVDLRLGQRWSTYVEYLFFQVPQLKIFESVNGTSLRANILSAGIRLKL
jgi:opacity protein-like surface antigen